MNINDFVKEKIAIAFTSPRQIQEFAKMCNGHNLKMSMTGLDACAWMLMEPKYLFNSSNGSNKVVYFVYDFNNVCGMSWCGDSNSDIGALNRHGYNVVPFEKFRECGDGIYTIVINCNGNDITTAKMIINGKVVKETHAKRNPGDKFDFKIGSRIAFDRLFERVRKDEEIEDCVYCAHFDKNSDYCRKINCRRAFTRSETADFDKKPIMFKKKR